LGTARAGNARNVARLRRVDCSEPGISRRQRGTGFEWRARRDQGKFDEMLDFARSLPKIRRRISFDRYLSGWTIAGAIAKVDDPSDITRPSTRHSVEGAVLDLITDERSPALERVSVG
jgi:hypothetical protein